MLKNVRHSDHADVAPWRSAVHPQKDYTAMRRNRPGQLGRRSGGRGRGDDATGPRLFVATPKDGLRGEVVGLDGPLFTGVRGRRILGT